jgi:hypothetical protein
MRPHFTNAPLPVYRRAGAQRQRRNETGSHHVSPLHIGPASHDRARGTELLVFGRSSGGVRDELPGEPGSVPDGRDLLAHQRDDARMPSERGECRVRELVRRDGQRRDLLGRDDLRRDRPERQWPVHELLHLDRVVPIGVRVRVDEHCRGRRGDDLNLSSRSPRDGRRRRRDYSAGDRGGWRSRCRDSHPRCGVRRGGDAAVTASDQTRVRLGTPEDVSLFGCDSGRVEKAGEE